MLYKKTFLYQAAKIKSEYGIDLLNDNENIGINYSAIVLAVGHDEFLKLDLRALRALKSIVHDLKGFFPSNEVDFRL